MLRSRCLPCFLFLVLATGRVDAADACPPFRLQPLKISNNFSRHFLTTAAM